MEYVAHILIMVAIYSILAASLNLITGVTGVISLAHAALYGVGAYVTALLALSCGVQFPAAIVIAMAITGLTAGIVGCALVRLPQDGVIVATFAFQILFTRLVTNSSATGGSSGLPGMPSPTFLGIDIGSPVVFSCIAVAIAAVSVVSIRLMVYSRPGRVFRAIRDDELLAATTGHNVRRYKAVAFAASGALAGGAGALYAFHISFVDPSPFAIMESIFILAAVLIGGAGTVWGPILGAVMLVVLPEILRFVGLPSDTAAQLRDFVFGACLVAAMVWRPRGLLRGYLIGQTE